MKPLTIEEVKALKAEDWVWVIDINSNLDGTYYISGIYLKICRINDTEIVFYMQNYASTLLRSFHNINANTFIFKNKEQAGNFADKLMECIEKGGYDGWYISYDFLENYESNCKSGKTAELHEILDNKNKKLTLAELKQVIYELKQDAFNEFSKILDKKSLDRQHIRNLGFYDGEQNAFQIALDLLEHLGEENADD